MLSCAGNKDVTVSYVLPCVLSLNTHLHDMKRQTKHCLSLVNSLMTRLKRRFRGIFEMTGIISNDDTSHSTTTSTMSDTVTSEFSDDLYFLSAVLHPTFAIHWIECDITESDFPHADLEVIRDNLRQKMQGRSYYVMKLTQCYF
jgi:hypothetical protein